MAKKAKATQDTGANFGFEDKLWAAADKLRGNMDAAEYKHVVLGLIFLKYISDPGARSVRESEHRELKSGGARFAPGDTLMARITPCLENGKTAFVDFRHDAQVGWGSTEYIALRPGGKIPPVFAYLLARTLSFRTFAIRQMTGSSGRQRVPPRSLSKFQIALPELDSPVYYVFGMMVQPLFNRIKLAMKQNRRLAGLRDVLLPKLLSGEIELPNADTIAEGCTTV